MGKPFESRIQDFVYNVDVGIGLRIIKVGLYILFILGLMLIYTVTQFKGLKTAESMDYAQLGRNVLQQKKFVTQYIRPASMWYLIENSKDHEPKIDQHPDILHPPLYPMLLAAGYAAINFDFNAIQQALPYPAEQWVVVPVNHVFTLLTGILVFLIALRLFDMRTAWIGMTLYFFSNMVWLDSISGSGLSIVTFFTTLAFYFALLTNNRDMEPDEDPISFVKRLIFFLLSILACVAAVMTRYAAIVIVPALLLYYIISYQKGRWVWVSTFIVLFLLGISPWLIRNIIVSGSPLGLAPYTALINSSAFPGDTMERTLAPTVTMSQIIPALKAKWMSQVVELYQNPLRTLGDGIIICFFIVTFFYRFVRPQVRQFRWTLALGIILALCLSAFFSKESAKIIHIFWPFAILYGLVFFYMLLDRLNFEYQITNFAVIAVLVLLCFAPFLFAILPPMEHIPYPPYYPPYIRIVSGLLDPNEMICTDMPWATAWYGQRTSLYIPSDINEFYEINDYTKRISGMYVTTLTRDKRYVSDLLTGPYKSWMPIFEGRIPSDFPLTQGFPIGDMNQLFLSDRRRWEEQR